MASEKIVGLRSSALLVCGFCVAADSMACRKLAWPQSHQGRIHTAAGQRLVMAKFDRPSRSKSTAMPMVRADMPNCLDLAGAAQHNIALHTLPIA